MGRAGTSFFHSLLTSHLLSRSSVSIFVGFITYSDSLIALSEIGSWDVITLCAFMLENKKPSKAKMRKIQG